MRLTKDGIVKQLTDKDMIEIFLNSGWVEVKPKPEKNTKKADK